MKKRLIVLFGLALGIWFGVGAQVDNGALVQASIFGDLPEVQKLVENGADVNAEDEYGNVPLMRAAIGCHLPVVRYLVAHKANVNYIDAGYATPVILSGGCGLEQIKFLVDNGADINAVVSGNAVVPNWILPWALDNTCDWDDTKESCSKDLDALAYIVETADFALMGETLRQHLLIQANLIIRLPHTASSCYANC